jgi:PAS domain S-box-containing protein
VRCTLTATGGGVHLEVADSGPGISPADRGAVFDRFRQVGWNPAARRAGTGLGLAIVRELVELHGGEISVHGAPEGGASFIVDLPSQAVASHKAVGSRLAVAERQRPALERLRSELAALDRRRTPRLSLPEPAGKAVVLIITADPELGAFLEDVVAERYSFAHAVGIGEALRVVGGDRPDVVLLDPAVLAETPDGEPIAELQRRLPGVSLVALAADGEAAAVYLRAGVDDCVLKPFSTHELLARLDKAAARLAAERRRQEIVTRLRSSFEQSPVGVCLVSLDRQVMQVNQALCDLLGYSREELLRMSVHDLTPRGAGRGTLPLDWRIGAGPQRTRLVRADGSTLPGLVSVSVQRDEQGAPYFIAYVEELAEGRSAGHPRRLAALRTRDARYAPGGRR